VYRARGGLVFTSYSFTSRLVCTNRTILSFAAPTCIAHPGAILLHDYWAVYDPPLTACVYTIHHRISAITISCKGQGGGGDQIPGGGLRLELGLERRRRTASWPLQDILLLRGFCTRINCPFVPPPTRICPHYCTTLSLLLRKIRPPPLPPPPPSDSMCVYHRPYNIGHGNIVYRVRGGGAQMPGGAQVRVRVRVRTSTADCETGRIGLAYTRCSFTCFGVCKNQSSLYYPRPFALPTRLQYIARILRNVYPPPDTPFICHAPYNIGSDNIV